jgi:hypothetical protein
MVKSQTFLAVFLPSIIVSFDPGNLLSAKAQIVAISAQLSEAKPVNDLTRVTF